MKGNSEYNYDVFISHSVKDREFVTLLATDLMQAGLSVWLDQWNVKVGDSFAKAIYDAIKESRFLLIVMSPDYFHSAWNKQEWQYALASEIQKQGVRLIPVLYRDCDIPPMLRIKQWVDFRDQTQYKMILHHLVRDLYRLAPQANVATFDNELPKPGERLEELDQNTIFELKQTLKAAVEAFRTKPDADAIELPESEEDMIEKDVCFVIMPFSDESLNIVYEDFVKPVLSDKCHIHAERGDDLFGSNVIMDDITKSIRKARLVIADLTGRNPNVFYEVGIAHALKKQVLLMTQSIDDVPFDLRHRRALIYEYSPRGCKKLEKDLFENVQDMLG